MTGSLRAILLKLFLFTAVTLVVTGLLAAVIGNIQPFTASYDVKAEFSDATGLLEADIVKVAGVTVGKVVGAELQTGREGGRAVVTLRVERGVTLPETTWAAIRFRNLLGQRMVVLWVPDDERDAPPLPQDGTALIPLRQTTPAFDLGVVFNNLRPVFRALDPEDANIVSRAIVQIFSGREVQTQQMVADLADLAESLGDRGPVAADLVTDLSRLLSSLAERDRELRSVLASFDQLMDTLGARSGELARTVDNLGVASDGLADLLEGNRPELDQTISQLAAILAVVAQHKDDLDQTLKNLPATTHALNRATTYGEWANLTGVCVDGICEEGFQSTGLRSGGLTDILGTALRGAGS